MKDHSLILCPCSCAFVRPNKRGSSWACPACGEARDVDNLLAVDGPARTVGATEFEELCKPEITHGHGYVIVTPEGAVLHEDKMEDFSDQVIALAKAWKLSRQEVLTTMITIAVNHAVATFYDPRKLAENVQRLYSWRVQQGFGGSLSKLVVPETPK